MPVVCPADLGYDVAGCRSAPTIQYRLEPLTGAFGDLNELCTKLPSEWESATYQRTRRTRIRQADALISVLRRRPDAKVRARFIEAHSGETVVVSWTVRHLAAEQLADYDAAHYCTRAGTPTSREAARAALRRIATLRRLVTQP